MLMKSDVTLSAQRYNIKPMVFAVAMGVMIITCALTTYATLALLRMDKFSGSNCVLDSPTGALLPRIADSVSARCRTAIDTTLDRFFVSSKLGLSLRGTIVPSATFFAVDKQAIWGGSIFPELRNGFQGLAFVTLLHYDGLRHGNLLTRLLCSGPVTGSRLCPARSILLIPSTKSRRIYER